VPIPDWVAALPSINAALNGLASVLLIGGYLLIRSGRRSAHRNTMLTAFATSIAFLICYVTYHAALVYYTGDGSKRYPAEAPGRGLYLTILATHVVLAVTVPVLASIACPADGLQTTCSFPTTPTHSRRPSGPVCATESGQPRVDKLPAPSVRVFHFCLLNSLFCVLHSPVPVHAILFSPPFHSSGQTPSNRD